jgi:hypothetical protein
MVSVQWRGLTTRTHFKIKTNSLFTTKYEVSVNNFEDDFKAANNHSPGPN